MSKSRYNLDKEAAEKKLVRDYFNNKKQGVFVDVGGNDPVAVTSQSWHLEDQLQWRGVVVEPNPKFLQQCREKRRAICFACACVEHEDERQVTLYVPVLNGNEMDSHAAVDKNIDDFNYRQHTQIKVPAYTLESILKQAGITAIDLLSIDVEGAELQVLKGFNIKRYQPGLILLEDKHLYLTKHRYLKRHGYVLVKRTGRNFWYVPKEAQRPKQDTLEKLKLVKRMYISIWWKKLKFSIRNKTLEPILRL